MNKLFITVFVVIALYYLKVPVVVTFIDQLLASMIPVWDRLIDEWIYLSDRHTYIYVSLPVVLFYLMTRKD